ncbi:hypothetical protein QAD02_011534 [Eretmocerus hayati]|uniref:Uncharacterized protein n=1 Tax=Eretmocerus hayati TaxID=131215 RepID=A0ACC2NY07_9HYME|nr:hypothetical protein QAD02_011534 [Eretmocerus hayati]
MTRGKRVGQCTRHAATTSPAHCSKSAQDANQNSKDDVVFISSKDNEASALWVNYLTACFEQISRQQGRPPFRVSQVTLEEPLGPGAEYRLRSSRLQIVVVCPMFLERVLERPEQTSSITRQLCTENVLAMMLGVQDAQLNSAHRANLNTYQNWRKFFVKDQDETFVGQFLGAAVAALASPSPNGLKTDKTVFSVHPKKVKMGHNRILALLNEPLQPNDNVTVTVDRCGEAIEVTQVKRRNPYTLQFTIPERCLDVSMLVGVRITRNGAPLGCRQVKCESRLRELDQILRAHDNPLEFMCQTFGFSSGDKEQLDNWMVHAFQKNIPPHFNLLSNPTGDLQLSKNQSSSEENPTLLHFAARFGLEKLAWQLLECPGGDLACDMRNVNDMTPADLAEQAGHVKLAHQLRGYMQMNEFSNMYSYLKVMSENTKGGANGQRGGMDDDALSSVSCPRHILNQQQEDYCRPRPLSEAYAVPPMARPVSNIRGFPDYSMPLPVDTVEEEVSSSCSASVVTSLSGSNASTPMAIYSSSSTLNASSIELPLQGVRSSNSLSIDSPDGASAATPPSSSASGVTGDTRASANDNASDKTSIGGSSRVSKSSKSDEPQDELLEIITDFKNNVFTISEVERLVETWRNRNDVQQSFKDKQRQLSAMRDEYERIQKRIKDEMKAPTPFDRIRKFFTKGKKDSKDATNSKDYAMPNKQNGVGSNLAERRPVSSLSLHSVSSSSSSGRMSTVSGCSGASLGDSGTHSDADDRRLQQHAVLSESKNNPAPATSTQTAPSGMSNYEIPPAPKPFHSTHQSPKVHSSVASSRFATPVPSRGGSELDLRPVKSSYPTADDKEYYIEFPPSGLPVHSFKPNGVARDATVSNTPNALDQPSSTNKARFHQNSTSHTNLLPPAPPPPGMCIPFDYVNISPATCNSVNITSKPEASNVFTVKPEIHAHEDAMGDGVSGRISNDDNNEQQEDEASEQSQSEDITPESPKILNTELPEYTNVQIAASEEIARNFGVTLKRLPAPPVPPRCEFNFPDATVTKTDDGVDTTG